MTETTNDATPPTSTVEIPRGSAMEVPPSMTAPDSLDRGALLAALRAFQRGEFDVRLPDKLSGLDGEICAVFNDIAQQADEVVFEVGAVRKAIGVEGQTKRRVRTNSAKGGWSRLVNSVNDTLDDLTTHSDEIARVVTAVAKGDLSQTVDIDETDDRLKGEFLRHARAVNGMVEQLALFGSEVTRVAQEVGVEGKLGAQAQVPGVSGAWKELTDSVNLMASNLTAQVREIARVTTAVAQGDLTKTVNMEVKGEILELKNTINTMVDQLGSFADEVTRVAREVGSEGILGGQARVRGVSGVWKELTDNVNLMANNLTSQVRNIADVSTAIAEGDLSKKITVEVKGEMLELKNTINKMVDQLGAFADEVTRVAREVGTEGRLGGQAEVAGVSGVWRELTENVNLMALNLTNQVRNVAEVVTAIAEGDLSKKITVDARGEILALKSTINDTVDKLNHFSAEVTRVARLVGTEGTLGVQAEVKGVSGIWKELTDNVNTMGRNLTDQVRDIAEVTTAVANGDLSKKITVEVRGEISQLKTTINAMVDSLSSFADEVNRMAREVGSEGVLGGQAEVHDVSGIWKELTDNVNSMANNLTNQVRNIAEVATAVATGDLSKKITVDARGEIQDLKETINNMVDQLNAFSAEVTRVAREVGVEGKLGGQAEVAGVRGSWKELTDNVNLMASNLTNQVRDIAGVTTAVANGDLTRKITVEARGEILELKSTVNTMVDQLSSFAAEVTRLASEVGVEGKLGGQADVRGVSGTWRDLTDAVNSMATNLTDQVRNISQVASAIAEGDLRKKIVVDARGEILELKNTINTMVDQLNSFAEEVTRVAREVGTEGKLGGQAEVEGARGIWKELTDNVNLMTSNVTNQVRDISQVATAIASGDLGRKITVEVRGELLELKNTINTMVDQLSSFADEVTRVSRDVGVEGKLGGQAEVRGVSGIWKELTDNVNMMASNLTDQVRDIARVTTAVANGDLSQKITVEVKGEILQLKNTINTMVDQLSSFADEVTRVAREVGVEGELGGQAEVRGVSGTWRELTDNVNVMARNLTEQVRGIARVVTAVANGDLKQQLQLEAKGEIAALVQTINDMIVTLSTFADQVSGVARDVGVEGKLGGQADVPGAAGIWRDLTNNVNELAGNLTRQVRAIGDVATAVTKGDLTRTIDVEARGEVAELKDNINQMIRTLAETTRVNEEQDWLKTNLTRFTRMLQGQRDLLTVARQVLDELAQTVDAQHGAFYMTQRTEEETNLKLYASYAWTRRKNLANTYELGEGIVGQSALEKRRILITNVPPDYVTISSALGESAPLNIVVVPILFEGEVKGVIELSSFHNFTPIQIAFIDQLIESLGIVIATIEATMRTDELLRQSQAMAGELQAQQQELQQTNEELEHKAKQLTTQRDEVERKNREVELAKQELEEKAEQLALTSKYKSQFLANMSHELRTPLNSLLILSKKLAENIESNLSLRQVQYAQTIYQAGSDLLALINEILDLAKVESGTMAVEPTEVRFRDLYDYVDGTFRQLAKERGLELVIEMDRSLPSTMVTDDMRLRQVLRNLLSNAIKFTEEGSVTLQIGYPNGRGWSVGHESLDNTDEVIAIRVRDTGIGIPHDKQAIIFEAFQQADGGTSRKYAGTGLGLSISREIARLLGGEIEVASTPGEGSVFTLFLPRIYPGRAMTEESRETRRGTLYPGDTGSRDTGPLDTSDLGRRFVRDDRDSIVDGDQVVLIATHDENRADRMVSAAREAGMKAIVGRDSVLARDLVDKHSPNALVIDQYLGDADGRVFLDRFRRDPATRHIPCVLVAGNGISPIEARRIGALGLIHPDAVGSRLVNSFHRLSSWNDDGADRILLVGADLGSLQDELEADGIEVSRYEQLEQSPVEFLRADFDCVVFTRVPEDAEIRKLLEVAERSTGEELPVLVLYGKPNGHSSDVELLSRLNHRYVVMTARDEPELDFHVATVLHRKESDVQDRVKRTFASQARREPGLRGRNVLIVDDDVRNIFAITAVLEEHGMNVTYAENGEEALAELDKASFEVVLMDIMMPGMDGYEATRRIRRNPRYEDLPIIALTAKAMKGDREKCIEAGASDYITKPVDSHHLTSMLRVWLRAADDDRKLLGRHPSFSDDGSSSNFDGPSFN